MVNRKYEDLPHVKRTLNSLKKLAKDKGLSIQDVDYYEEKGYRRLALFTEDFKRFHVAVNLPYLNKEFPILEKQIYGSIFKIHKKVKKLKPFIN